MPQGGEGGQQRTAHRRKIGAVPLLLLLVGCGRATSYGVAAPPDPAEAIRRGPPIAPDRAWWLERSGPSPSDTALAFPAREGRTIVLRHGAPDHAIYFVLAIPAGALVPAAGDSARLTIRALPGRYGVALGSPDAFGEGITGTFSYATHFQAPSDAAPRYPTPVRFEQALGAARLADSLLRFLPTDRPAGDMARFPVAGAGTYLLAAPK